MGREPSIEELLNIIFLQKKALEFYGDKCNYINNKTINTELCSSIELDGGHQARFALKQSNVAEEYHDNLLDSIKEYKDIMDINENSMDKFKNFIEEFKKLNEE